MTAVVMTLLITILVSLFFVGVLIDRMRADIRSLTWRIERLESDTRELQRNKEDKWVV